VKKQWKLHSLSPLYNFKLTDALFKKYGRSLDAAFSQTNAGPGEDNASVKSHFSVYSGVNVHEDDPPAVRIQVFEKNAEGGEGKEVLTALLLSVDIDHAQHPITERLQGHFLYYPVLMVCGTVGRAEALFTWMERHFDCHVVPLSFSNTDMRWMLANWCSRRELSSAPHPVMLQYSLKELAPDMGIHYIDCKIDSKTCAQLWERLFGDSTTRKNMDESVTDMFMKAVEQHLEYTMSIYFSKLGLSEIGTSLAYISSLGKLKILSNAGVYQVLHLICIISQLRFHSIQLLQNKSRTENADID